MAKYAILVAGEPDQAVIDKKGGFQDMFLRLLREDGAGEQWRVYAAFRGELPSPEELADLRGVVITGSVADAFGTEQWLLDLRRTVRAAMEQRKRVLTLWEDAEQLLWLPYSPPTGSLQGICFGHQLVGLELGAPVGRAGCWELGTRRVEVRREAAAALAAGGAAWAGLLPEQLCLHEFHQDQVLAVPPGATLLASSERTPVEMFAVGAHVLCIQGHPEFDGEVVRMLAEPREEKIGAADYSRMRDTLASLPAEEQAGQLQAFCRAFLKG